MHLLSVNVAVPRSLNNQLTGICKTSVSAPIRLGAHGLEGDTVCDMRHHGGADQAVYAYSQEDYEWWESCLERTFHPGTFGENLTISGLSCSDLLIGDRLEIGEAVLEVTAPRIPCSTLGRRVQDPRFPAKFRLAERPGVYCRVLQGGWVQADIPVAMNFDFRSENSSRVPVLELFRSHFSPTPDSDQIEALLAAPIARRERERLSRMLASN